nr:family 43 glycosylhydrolase [Clostridia bacterium]
MKKIISLILVAVSLFAILAVAASASTLTGTMVVNTSVADPWMFYHDGTYYLVKTGSGGVALYKSTTIDGFTSSYSVPYRAATAAKKNDAGVITSPYVHYDDTIYDLFGEGAEINGTWSPEIHYFSEKDFPGNSGWYMFVALRETLTLEESPTGESANIRMVVLKSTTDSPEGPYGNPTTGITHSSALADGERRVIAQPFLKENGEVYDEWGCGQTILRIKEGEYAGIYAMWVSEENRGTPDFFQTISIAKLSTPWQIDGAVGTVTRPNQGWEKTGYQASATKYLPNVVEGATPIYGKNGEIFMIYCGGGYWTNGHYALGQLTWNGGNPLEESSWVKLSEDKNPIFSADIGSNNVEGAGHASFIQDKDGNGFAVYHAYRVGADGRRSFIEPYYIDYEAGIVHIGADDDRSPADYRYTEINFNDNAAAEYLEAPEVTALDGDKISLSLNADNAQGYSIYRSENGGAFSHLATVEDNSFVDETAEDAVLYSYRVYAYREEEISPASNDVVAMIAVDAPEITGDFNRDGKLSVLDVVSLIKTLVSNGKAYFYHDLNGDNRV